MREGVFIVGEVDRLGFVSLSVFIGMKGWSPFVV